MPWGLGTDRAPHGPCLGQELVADGETRAEPVPSQETERPLLDKQSVGCPGNAT